MKYVSALVCLLCIVIYSNAQQVRPEILAMADSLHGVYFDIPVDYKVSEREVGVEATYHRMARRATKEEMLLLTKHPNPAIRANACLGLYEIGYPDIISVVLDIVSDTSIIGVGGGCIIGDGKVGEICFNNVYPGPRYRYRRETRLNSKQIAFLDSLILYTDTDFSGSRRDLLLSLKQSDKNYQRLKHIAWNENDDYAIIALARYRHIEDTILIKKLFIKREDDRNDMWAIKQFPHEIFYPYLMDQLQIAYKAGNAWRASYTYRVLIEYPKEGVYKMLDSIVSSPTVDKTVLRGIAMELRYYKHDFFAPLLLKPQLSAIYVPDNTGIAAEEDDKYIFY